MAEQFDVVVLGGGPGGYAAALYAGSAGLRVAVILSGGNVDLLAALELFRAHPERPAGPQP